MLETNNVNGSAKRGSDTLTDPPNGNHRSLNISSIVHEFPEGLKQGQYQFPFTFVMPEGLPASWEGKFALGSIGEVKYLIIAEFLKKVPGSDKLDRIKAGTGLFPG